MGVKIGLIGLFLSVHYLWTFLILKRVTALFPPQLLSRKDKSSFDRLAFLMSKEDNYKRLRDFISTQSMVSCIPYLGRKQIETCFQTATVWSWRILNWQLIFTGLPQIQKLFLQDKIFRFNGNHVSLINVSGVISSSSLICTQKQYLFLSFSKMQYSSNYTKILRLFCKKASRTWICILPSCFLRKSECSPNWNDLSFCPQPFFFFFFGSTNHC